MLKILETCPQKVYYTCYRQNAFCLIREMQTRQNASSYNLGDMAQKFLPDDHCNRPTMSDSVSRVPFLCRGQGRAGPSDTGTG